MAKVWIAFLIIVCLLSAGISYRIFTTLDAKIKQIDASVNELKGQIDARYCENKQGSICAERLHERVLYSSVRISCEGTVGGGTVISCVREKGVYKIYILTAHHVVRKVTSGVTDTIEVKFYDGKKYKADIWQYNKKIDIAILEVKTNQKFNYIAQPATDKEVLQVDVFTRVYIMGCPLGHNPLPTPGIITSLHKNVGKNNFWLSSAPTIFGNSGGGVFLKESGKLVGITTMVCTYDEQELPVFHMSVVVPVNQIRKWLGKKLPCKL